MYSQLIQLSDSVLEEKLEFVEAVESEFVEFVKVILHAAVELDGVLIISDILLLLL